MSEIVESTKLKCIEKEISIDEKDLKINRSGVNNLENQLKYLVDKTF